MITRAMDLTDDEKHRLFRVYGGLDGNMSTLSVLGVREDAERVHRAIWVFLQENRLMAEWWQWTEEHPV